MTAEQWFWLLLIIANGLALGIRITLMQRDGTHRSDWMFISGDLVLIGYGAYVPGAS